MIDLFAGCGGLSLGMEQAGFTTIFANEINENLFSTYLHNRDLDSKSYFQGDINELNKNIDKYKIQFENIDLVCGGPPCQGFSMANRQRLLYDPRNVLYKAYLKFLSAVQPKFFVMENVKGLSNKIDEISSDFNEFLGKDYTLSYSLLNAKDFGLPQNRERFFIIGNRLDINTKILFDNIKKNKSKTTFFLKDAIEDLPKLKPNRIKNNTKLESEEIGFFERQYNYPKSKYSTFINNGKKVKTLYNHKNRYNNDRDIEIFTLLPQGGNSLHKSIEHIMPYKNRNHIFKDKYFKLNENDVCKTITSHMKHDCNMYIHPNQSRGLSPREAARVQTFPDYYVFTESHNLGVILRIQANCFQFLFVSNKVFSIISLKRNQLN